MKPPTGFILLFTKKISNIIMYINILEIIKINQNKKEVN